MKMRADLLEFIDRVALVKGYLALHPGDQAGAFRAYLELSDEAGRILNAEDPSGAQVIGEYRKRRERIEALDRGTGNGR